MLLKEKKVAADIEKFQANKLYTTLKTHRKVKILTPGKELSFTVHGSESAVPVQGGIASGVLF